MRVVLGKMPCITAGCRTDIELVVDDGYERTSTRSSLRTATMKAAAAGAWKCTKCGWTVPLATEMLDELARQTADLDR